MRSPSVCDPSTNRALVQERVRQFLREKKLRVTPAREAILEEIFSSHDHFHAEGLWERLRKSNARISRMTVYRMLKVLVESRYLVQLDLGTGQRVYDPNYSTRPAHNHILCKDCNQLVEFDDPCLDLRERALVERMGFRAGSLVFRVEARCLEKGQTGRCSRQEATTT
jgi:Fur family transcriptional regulator, ferric uptake regulator